MKKQFFPNSDRSELIVEVYLPRGSAFKRTEAVVARVERRCSRSPRPSSSTPTSARGAPRFFLSLNPELPDPAFAKLIVQTRRRRGARPAEAAHARAHRGG